MPPISVRIEELPQSVEGFVALQDQLAGTPQGGAAMMVVALLLYVEDDALGQQCLAVAVDFSCLQPGSSGYRGWQLRPRYLNPIHAQLSRQPCLPRSYLEGATPANGYALPPAPYAIWTSPNPDIEEVEYARRLAMGWRLPVTSWPDSPPRAGSHWRELYVASSGADSLRPLTLVLDRRRFWKAAEWRSLLGEIAPPVDGVEDRQ